MTVILTVVGVVVAPSGVPVTWMVCDPVATEEAIAIVRTLDAPVDDGVTDAGLNEVHVMPEGRGVTQESATDCEVPAFSVAVIVTVPELPCWMLTGPLLDSE